MRKGITKGDIEAKLETSRHHKIILKQKEERKKKHLNIERVC